MFWGVSRPERLPPQIIDADFESVRGPYRVGEEHRSEKGWRFTGQYNGAGHPLFLNSRWLRWRQVRAAAADTYAVAFAVLAFGLLAYAAYAFISADLERRSTLAEWRRLCGYGLESACRDLRAHPTGPAVTWPWERPGDHRSGT